MFNANVTLKFYVLYLWFKANYKIKILGIISYILFKVNFTEYISIYWFKFS
jgi:hypothetical protein